MKKISRPIADVIMSAFQAARDLTRANREKEDTVVVTVTLVNADTRKRVKEGFKAYSYPFAKIAGDGSFVQAKIGLLEQLEEMRDLIDSKYSLQIEVGLVTILVP